MTQGFVGADPDRLDALGNHMLGQAQLLDDLRATLTTQLYDTGWSGADAEAHQTEWETTHAPTLGLAALLLRTISITLNIHAIQQRVTSAADPATGTTVAASTPTTTGDRNDPDGRGGRRLRNDEVFRREEGGGGSDHFSNDWAGRAILGRYLSGGDDWTIVNDPDWNNYMMGNQSLRDVLLDPVQIQAQTALNSYLGTGNPSGTFDTTFSAEMENGEGIVGYQYLHGTNSDAGGFQFNGTTTVTPLPDGTYQVVLNSGYTWNDVIDPNPQYATDQWKSQIAEIITLGAADPYDIHITWNAQTTVILDASGNVISIEGYPAP